MKSYTDIKQSQKLSEILPLETADCFWDYDEMQKFHRINWFEEGYNKNSQLSSNKNNVCAWSLAALLDVFKLHGFKPILDLKECSIQYSGIDYFINIAANNPIDACYETIIALNKLKRL